MNPGKVLNRNGYSITTSGDVWVIHSLPEDYQINWRLVDCASDIKDSLKAHIIHLIESKAPATACTAFDFVKYTLQEIPLLASLNDLTFPILEGALTKMRLSNSEWKFGHVRRWYKWCTDQGIPGFNEEIAKRLYEFTLRPNTSGQAVMTRDPRKGPLSEEEHWLIRQAVKQGKGSLLGRICVMLLLETGARPTQLISLDEQDLHIIQSSPGHNFYSLSVQRVKQRTVGPLEKKLRRISQELGRKIEELIDENHSLHSDDGPEKPILLSSTTKPLKIEREDTSDGTRGLRMRRMTSQIFKYRVSHFAFEANIISPRTGEIINLFPYRLRYTFGIRHAEQGTPSAVLADLLDHTRPISVRVYTKSTNNLVPRLNTILGDNEQYNNIIKRFLGEISSDGSNDSPNKVVKGTTPTMKNLGGIGACGANFLCKLMPPLSCYVCPKFQAWVDGPHQEMLHEVENYSLKLAEVNGNNPSDRIPHQLVDVIAAIKELLMKIGRLEHVKAD
jgi:integrase